MKKRNNVLWVWLLVITMVVSASFCVLGVDSISSEASAASRKAVQRSATEEDEQKMDEDMEALNRFLDRRLAEAKKISGYTPSFTLYFYKSDSIVKLYDVDASKISFDFEDFRSEVVKKQSQWWKHDLACVITGLDGRVVLSEDKLIGISFNPASANDDIMFSEGNEAFKMRLIIH